MATDSTIISLEQKNAHQLFRVAIFDDRKIVANEIAKCLNGQDFLVIKNPIELAKQEAVIFSPLKPVRTRFGRELLAADFEYAKSTIHAVRDAGVNHLVLLSSAEIYGSDFHNPGIVPEDRKARQNRTKSIAEAWSTIEALATESLKHTQCRLTILRCSYVLHGDKREFANRFFRSRIVFPFAGYDPCIQLLSLDDFANAISQIVQSGESGVYNLASREVVSLRKAIQIARLWRIPIPYTIQRIARAILAPIGLAASSEQAEYLRFPWTVSIEKLCDTFAFRPKDSSITAIRKHVDRSRRKKMKSDAIRTKVENISVTTRERAKCRIDDFGMDEEYIHSCGRWQFSFMEKCYWRIEADGLDYIPKVGGAVLAGIHRGFMPFDGVMLVHLLSKYAGRIPRFLIHPGLVKHPHLSGFLTRIGGVIACQENADHILTRQEILGVFPEGIRGAFRMYDRNIYKIGKYRDDYIKCALRHRVPIIPFVTVGPAESFPIFGKIESTWWKKQLQWPFIPITPTANLIPLPTKWHFRFLKPIPTDHLSPDAANNKSLVRALSQRVQAEMQSAIDDMLSRRRSIFWGSIFEHEQSELSKLDESRVHEIA